MHREQRQQTHDLLQKHDTHRALFSHVESVKWLTGFAPPVQTGPNPFAAAPPLLWYEDGHYTLMALDSEAAAYTPDDDVNLLPYTGYQRDAPIDSVASLREVFQSVVADDALGVEMERLPAYLYRLIQDADITPIDGWLAPLRMVKTDEELAKLRRNFALTDIGHQTAAQTIRARLREIDLWTTVHAAINREAGERVPLGNDCVVGYRAPNNIGGWPLDYEIKPDSSLILDLSTIWQGYWSDSCATYYPGEMTAKQAAMHRTAHDALDFGASLLRPGVRTNEIDQQMRGFMEKAGYPVYPHHTGHGIGVSGHEEPRIVPYNEVALQAGMVIMLEPGIYFPGETSVRLEDAFLITSDGAQRLTTHLE